MLSAAATVTVGGVTVSVANVPLLSAQSLPPAFSAYARKKYALPDCKPVTVRCAVPFNAGITTLDAHAAAFVPPSANP
jgi:hypothetical protein